MRYVLAYTKTYKSSASIALILMLLELVVELVQPLLMAKIIDDGILQEQYSVVALWGGILLLLSLTAFAAGITNSFYASRFSQGVGYDLRRDLFRQVQAFTDENFQRIPTPSLVTRVTNDVIQIQNFLFMFVRIGLRAPLFIVFALIMAFTIDVRLAVIMLGSVPFLLVFLYFVLTKGVRLFRNVQTKLDALNTVIRENLTGIRLIKGFHRQAHEKDRFSERNDDLVKQNKRALWLVETAMPVVMLGMNVVILFLLFFGGEWLRAGDLQAGEVVAIINYATRILFTFSVFTFLIMVFSRAYASAVRLEEVGREDTDIAEPSSPVTKELQGSVTFQDVSFERSGECVLQEISFQIEAGQTVGILGETGSGKTSLLHLIPRLYEKNSGQLSLDGEELENFALLPLRKKISLVPQDVHLFSGSVRENIAWGKEDATEEEVKEAAERAQIHSFISSLPDGYDTEIGQKGVVFSGGQKQRLSIARALVRKPKILLLDDSTSALDAHTEQRLFQALNELRCTVFIVAQKISSVENADTILLLQNGRLIANGTHEELLDSNDFYREVHATQQEGVIS
ncbi:ABC transporter ATP-binding protein [Halobacillus sp. BAB-2008]|uniref:ABC transporter ATP-binding protein n=1 Tax=Halobacillus sp. BAB-2008 TaxID=1246484 RepID=UPI0002A515CB|nr:ABC transporter ATP-binding protein [Halobacillus sp. BAB-2008]ELK46342.1 ABC-type transport system ATP-binding/permease protein [Halobacillus sp. BAB-2008]